MFQPKGIIVPVVTPFSSDHSVDEQALRRIIRHVVDNGVHGVFVTGTTGEFYALSHAEHQRLFEIAVDEVAGKVPVYGGTSGISTDDAVALTKIGEKVGLDAVSVLTPFFISLSQEELYQHYKTIAASTNLPILLYDNKPKTNLTIAPATVERLSKIDNIVGMKDSTGDFTNTMEILRRTRNNPDFHVLIGRDSLIFSALCSGCSGAVAGCGNVAPRLCSSIYDKYVQGDFEGAREDQFTLLPLRLAFAIGSFPAVIKEAMSMVGIDAGACKRPTGPLSDDQRKQVQEILRGMGLLNT